MALLFGITKISYLKCIRKKSKESFEFMHVQPGLDISIVEYLQVIIWRLALLLYADQWQSGYHTKFALLS